MRSASFYSPLTDQRAFPHRSKINRLMLEGSLWVCDPGSMGTLLPSSSIPESQESLKGCKIELGCQAGLVKSLNDRKVGGLQTLELSSHCLHQELCLGSLLSAPMSSAHYQPESSQETLGDSPWTGSLLPPGHHELKRRWGDPRQLEESW